jgi:nucleoside-diphosphate-sugar epimerase
MILVTGGTGFLGAYILQDLIGKGHRVRALRRSHKLPFFLPEAVVQQVEWVDGDVLDIISLHDAMEGVDAVIHSAAVVSFAREDRKRMYQVNVEGTANIVNAAIDCGVRRLLHVSSVAALGRTTKVETVTEEKKWEDNRNNTHYARSKHQAEMHVWRGFAEGLDGVIINPGTILGYGNWHQSSCAIFRNAYREFPWYTKGTNGFVGVKDVAKAAVELLVSDINHKRFIVNAENWSFQRLFDTLADRFHKKRPHREATKTLGAFAWRLEKVRAAISGSKPLLTRETARVAHSLTSFDNGQLLKALPHFHFTPLEDVIAEACRQYEAEVAL